MIQFPAGRMEPEFLGEVKFAKQEFICSQSSSCHRAVRTGFVPHIFKVVSIQFCTIKGKRPKSLLNVPWDKVQNTKENNKTRKFMGKKNINKCWGENDNIMGERGKNMEVEEEGRWKWKEKKMMLQCIYSSLAKKKRRI